MEKSDKNDQKLDYLDKSEQSNLFQGIWVMLQKV